MIGEREVKKRVKSLLKIKNKMIIVNGNLHKTR
jgi:hypothetical protein